MRLLNFWNSKAKQRESAVEAVKAEREKQAAFEIEFQKARDYIEARAGLPISKLSDYNSFLAAGTGLVWASFRACHLVGSTVSSAALSVVDIKTGTPMELVKPPASFLQQPNPYDSMEEIIYMWVCHMKLTGNAYWLKDEANAKGQPLAIYPLLPQFIKVIPHRVTRVAQYIYSVNGQDIPLPPEAVIHFRRPHPTTFLHGLGDVEGGAPVYNSYVNRGALEEKYLANGAQPSGVLTRKESDLMGGTTPEMWEALKAKFNKEYTGRSNAGKTVFLNGDWSYLKMGLTMQEMEALEKERWSVEQIFLNHGVPLSVAGIRNSANYACLPAGELVTMADGSPKAIEMIQAGELIYQFDENKGTVVVPVEAIIPQGEAPVFEIHTDARSLRASDNHPILTLKRTPGTGRYGKRVKTALEWKRAEDVKAGDVIVVYEEAPPSFGKNPIPNRHALDAAYFLGQYVGDGSGASLTRSAIGGFTIATHEYEGYQEEVCRALYNAFGLIGSYEKTGIRFSAAWLARAMVDAGLGGVSKTKQIPSWVFSLPTEERAEFLSGLLDADGTVAVRGTITFGVANKLLAEQTRHLAISLGLPVTRLRCCHQVTNFGPVDNWRWTIGIISAAQKILRLRNPKKKQRLKDATTNGFKTGKGVPLRLRLGEFTLPDGYGLQKVRSVVSLGSMPVFDLATTGSHTFIASGVVTHNTARQEDIAFRRYECVPLLRLLVGKLNSTGGLALPYGDNLRFKFELSGLIDVEQIMKDYLPMVMAGAMTPNELREKAGLSKVEDALLDQYFMRAGVVPIEMAGLAGGGEQEENDDAKNIVTGGGL